MVIKKNKMKRNKWWLKLIDSTAFEEAFQGIKATCDTALKTGDMGIFKKREVTCLRC